MFLEDYYFYSPICQQQNNPFSCKSVAAVSCSCMIPGLAGPGFGSGMTGKLGCAWVVHGIGAGWVSGGVVQLPVNDVTGVTKPTQIDHAPAHPASTMHRCQAPPMHGPTCPSSQTQIPSQRNRGPVKLHVTAAGHSLMTSKF